MYFLMKSAQEEDACASSCFKVRSRELGPNCKSLEANKNGQHNEPATAFSIKCKLGNWFYGLPTFGDHMVSFWTELETRYLRLKSLFKLKDFFRIWYPVVQDQI